MKKIIPAMCLLLVSAVLMGTSTFAWFTMNTTVIASGMKVNAVVPKSIVISTESGGTYSASVDLGMTDAQTLYPSSTVTTQNWYAPDGLIDNRIDPITGDATLTEEGTDFVNLTNWADGLLKDADGTNVYAVNKTVYVKSADAEQAVYGLYVSSLTVGGESIDSVVLGSEVSKALRVAVVTAEKTLVYAPNGYDTECNPIASLGGTGGNVGTADSNNFVSATLGSTGSVLIENTEAIDTEIEINIFIWYEGQD